MPIVKNDGYGVYKVREYWWFRTYRSDDIPQGPFETRVLAMEGLLTTLGFDVAQDVPPLISGLARTAGDRK